MPDLSSPPVTWLLILLAGWISFVKSSIQAAIAVLVLCALTGLWFPAIGSLFLLFTSLLIPKPNPRHQKRRFQIAKFIYTGVFIYAGFSLKHHFALASQAVTKAPDLEGLLVFLAPISFFIFVIFLLMTRKYAA